MLSIGNKKYRNLQEQVAYNTECIKKLDEYLDGITIEDKLVVIETDSGTFTDEDLVILSGPLAFISNNSRVWMKDSETLTELVFKAIDIKATEVGTYFNIGGSKIVVNRETGAYNTSSDTIITTYSKAQIDNALSLKASLTGADFTGNVRTTGTLEQQTANYEGTLSIIKPSGITEKGTPFEKFKVINSVCYLIVETIMQNLGESNITGQYQFIFYVPIDIRSKIYRKDGTNLTQPPLDISDYDGCSVTSEVGIVGITATYVDFISSSVGTINVQINGVTINAGSSKKISFRTFLILI